MSILIRNGQLLFKSAGIPGFAAEDVLPCDGGPACGGDPSMELKVTSVDANLPVTWCGKTWVKSTETPGVDEAHSGEPQCVCPTNYNLGAPMGNTNAKQHWWAYNGTNSTKGTLNMNRIAINGGPAYYQPEKNTLQVRILGNTNTLDYQSWYFTPFTTPTMDYTYTFQLGILAPGAPPQPTFSNYKLTNNFFDMYVEGGVTLEWGQGERWG